MPLHSHNSNFGQVLCMANKHVENMANKRTDNLYSGYNTRLATSPGTSRLRVSESTKMDYEKV